MILFNKKKEGKKGKEIVVALKTYGQNSKINTKYKSEIKQ